LNDKYDKKLLAYYTLNGNNPTYQTFRALLNITWTNKTLDETFKSIRKEIDLDSEIKYAAEVQRFEQKADKLKLKWGTSIVESVYKWTQRVEEVQGLEALKILNTSDIFMKYLLEMEQVKKIQKERAERKVDANKNKRYYKKKYKGKYKKNYYKKNNISKNNNQSKN